MTSPPSIHPVRALACVLLVAAACGKPGPGPSPVPDAGKPPLPTDSCIDNDGDGIAGTGSCAAVSPVDCKDTDPNVFPGGPELCDGVDNNCDGTADENVGYRDFFPDGDADGFGAKGSTPEKSCEAGVPGKVANQGDCLDSDPAVKPGVTELCNGRDDNCDGSSDEGLTFTDYYPDFDGDTYGSSSAAAVSACQAIAGKVTDHSDCNDSNGSIRPGAAEVCNNQDDNCDGTPDEGNPGGGGACDTGQAGVCAAGASTCQSGTLNCVRNTGPSAELCDGLDNNCNNQVDEAFTNKGQACTSGAGVCARTGTYGCKADLTGTECSATAGSPTAAACDGLDNDCDGVVDEPALTSTSDLESTAWQDLEFSPRYYSSAGCAGGVNGGTDALVGGALAMAKGGSGVWMHRLSSTGTVLGSAVQASSLAYTDIGIAQAGDGYVIAGIWGSSPEIDLYLMDGATGAKRTYLYSQFKPGVGNSIDSLRVVRGNGNRVVLVWREVITGATPATRIRVARVEPNFDGTTWTIRNAGGAVSPITSVIVPTGATVLAGLGADSSHDETGSSQTCQTATSLRNLLVSYLTSAQSLNAFGIWEDGTGKSVETVVRTVSSSQVLAEPEVTSFRAGGADQWFIGYVTQLPGTLQADLNYYMSNATGWHYAYLSYATENGAASILRPRASATSTHVFFSALRYVVDASGFKRQVMTRNIDLTGNRDPISQTVEVSATSGACGTDSACRPGNKDGLTSWAAKDRLFYSGSGSAPVGTYSSRMSCQ
ncbi:MAG: putative metal-binding motif-containing protein [Myxococcaceae bacterium]